MSSKDDDDKKSADADDEKAQATSRARRSGIVRQGTSTNPRGSNSNVGRARATQRDPSTRGGGAGAHNWGNPDTNSNDSVGVLDRGDPNYDSSEEKQG